MSYRTVTFGLLIALLVTLPLAHFKATLFGVPIYVPEAFLLIAGIAFLLGCQKNSSVFRPIREFDRIFLTGALLFLTGAVFSLLSNPLALTGLGMLKTWFVFPMLMAWLLFQMQPSAQERELLLRIWLFTISLTALSAISYIFFGFLTYDGRLAAWFGSPNYLAIFSAPGILIASRALLKALVRKNEWKEMVFPLASLAVLLTALFFTRSHGVWLGVLAGLVVMIAHSSLSKKTFLKILGAVILITGTFFFLEYDHSKWQSIVSGEERSSLASRVMIWQSAAKMLEGQPIFGIGLGRFQEVYLEYQKYFPPYLEWAVPQPHNIMLAVWLQTGILGLIGFSLLIGRAIVLLLQNKNRESALLLGILALYLIYGLFDTPYFKTDLAFSFWLLISFVLLLPKSPEELRK